MGGESRGRVVADEGVRESRSTREPVPYEMFVVIVLIIYNMAAAEILI